MQADPILREHANVACRKALTAARKRAFKGARTSLRIDRWQNVLRAMEVYSDRDLNIIIRTANEELKEWRRIQRERRTGD